MPRNRPTNTALILVSIVCFRLSVRASHADVLDDADPLVGSQGDGEIHPAVGVPFGLVWLGPDMRNHKSSSGYVAKGLVDGFSHTHVMGTGGASKYGNFLVTPVAGDVNLKDLGSPYEDEVARPGLYHTRLTRGDIKVDLTASRFVGVHNYTFPANRAAHVVIDVGSMVSGSARTRPVQTNLRVLGNNRIEGTVTITGGWNPMQYTMHFHAEFERPFVSHVLFNRGQKTGDFQNEIELRPGLTTASAWRNGVVLDFAPTKEPQAIAMKMGVSFVDTSRARQLIDQEAPGWNFRAHQERAEAVWRQALGKIKIEGATAHERRTFFSALYRLHLMPRDLTGQHPNSQHGEPYWTDFYCLWDTFRTYHPLMTLIAPGRQRDMVRGLLTVFKQTGWLPEAFIAGSHGLVQVGSNGTVVLADAILKNLPGLDLALAWEALAKDAEVDSPWPLYYGRELGEWKQKGFLSIATERSVSRTMEYAYNDFVISQVAARLGKVAEAKRYKERSRGWENLWDTDTRSVRPRNVDGAFVSPYDPLEMKWGFEEPYYEGNGRQYATFVPHDPQALINKLGGDAAFVAWLDEFFAKKIFWMGNEPGFLAPWLYAHAGRPDRTTDIIRGLLAQFTDTPKGIPGNDDAGAMSSWYMWNAMGLFPNAGQPYYYVGAPSFRRTTIALAKGKRIVLDAPKLSATNRYVVGVKVNGKPWAKNWIEHKQIANGARFEFDMGAQPSSWGQGERPPSMTPRR